MQLFNSSPTIRVSCGLVLFSALVIASTANGVVINEIRTGQPGNDNQDYWELAGTPFEPISGLTYLVLNNGPGPARGVMEYGFVLSGTIDYAGYYLAANGATFHFQYPFQYGSGIINGDYVYGFTLSDTHNVTHIVVDGFSCNGNNCAIGTDLDTNDDGILDYTPWSSVLDSVSIIVDPNALSGQPYYGPVVVPSGPSPLTHLYRYPNQTGPWQVGSYDGLPNGYLDTPGVANRAIPEPAAASLLLLRRVRLVSPPNPRGKMISGSYFDFSAFAGSVFFVARC